MDNETHSGAKSVTPGGSVAGGHTKGPWFTEYRANKRGGYSQEVFYSEGEVVATAARFPVKLNDTTTTTNREANARLIAAAPEILDALRRLLATTDSKLSDTHDDGCGCVFHEARAAIAKATAGETRNAEHTPTGYEDAASVVVNQAPAPSSLAGGEVRQELIELAIHKAIRDEAGPGLKMLITPRFVKAAAEAVLAALSPEAPARGKGPGGYLVKDFADGWYWTPNAALDHAGGAPVWSVSDARYETDPPALTPRHEAPASEGEV